LIHVSELGHDYFHFDEKAHAMVGERSGRRFRLSDRVSVQLVRADLETNKIDFRLVDGGAIGRSQSARNQPYSDNPAPKAKQNKSKGGRR
jgi:ribonuclease R